MITSSQSNYANKLANNQDKRADADLEDKYFSGSVYCPVCHKKIRYLVKNPVFGKYLRYPFPHALIHGIPKHVLIIYLDKENQIRATEIANSLEIR